MLYPRELVIHINCSLKLRIDKDKDSITWQKPYPCVYIYNDGFYVGRVRLDTLCFEDDQYLSDKYKQEILNVVCKHHKLLMAFHEVKDD